MTSLEQIEAAITALSPEDQAKLVQDLPTLLPELQGELAWQRILRDPTHNPALSKLADSIDAEFARNAEAFPQIKASDFDRNA